MEFVGYLLTPQGIRMRKKTTRHMKKSLKHIMNAYAMGAISYDHAMESVICYVGMCKHCNGRNMLRWIQDNFVLKRNETTMKEKAKPPGGRHFYNIHENEDGTVDVYLRPDVLPRTTDEGFTDYDVAVLVVKDVEPYDGLEDDIRQRFNDWCESAEVIYL